MKRALTLKYRPKTFEDVVGQNITTTILKRIVETKAYKNAYLFCGKSGCGKTTLARIFAYLINEGVGEPIEMDAASNNGVDAVRDIVDNASARSLTGKYKIYIIDECHAITTAGWQAFLKGIEEAPEYTIYLFCTTEPNKIPATILNRVQRYSIAPISTAAIKARLMYICEAEGFTNYEDTCDLISKTCNNGMRDAITMLEQCVDYSTDLSLDNAKQVLGELSYDTMFNLASAILCRKQSNVLSIVEEADARGVDLKHFVDQFLAFSIDLAKYCLFKDLATTAIPESLKARCDKFYSIPSALNHANRLTDNLLELKNMLKYDTQYKSTVEAYMLKMSKGE